MPPLAGVKEMPLTTDRTSLLQSAVPSCSLLGQAKKQSSGLGG